MVQLRPVGGGDLDACFALSSKAGWNQNAADWRLIYDLGHVVGLWRDGDGPLATAAVLPYGGRFGWICMVLVASAERRRGHATRLLTHCLDWLRERGIVAGLDATPAGREVYRLLGFRDVYPLTRLQSAGVELNPSELPGVDFRPMAQSDIDSVAEYDADIFGADRASILAALRDRVPRAALVAYRGGLICGYVLARDGRLATQVGPLIAENDALAQALMSCALDSISGPVFVDVADRHRHMHAWLTTIGFHVQRPYMRMLLGQSQPIDQPARMIAIAGPELG